MFIFLAILLSIIALLAVAYPIVFRAGTAQPATASAQESLDELLAQREAAFQALRELSFDHQVGKITDEDFTAFEANLKLHAADTLRALDRWEAQSDADLDDVLERAVRARRNALRADGGACPACGAACAAGDKFCPACGALLTAPPTPPQPAAAGRACPRCGRPAEAGDRFCAGCGQALPA